MRLIGRKDAWALSGIGAGFMAANPWLAGDLRALMALGPALAGGAWFANRGAQKWLNRVDTKKREGFILPSDPCCDAEFPEVMPTAKGLRIGYTRDNNLPLDIRDMFMQRHSAIIGQSGVGKTVLGEYLLWQQAARGGGFLFIDAKLDAETRDRLGFMMSTLGREDDFYVINVDNPNNSNTYNPILAGDPDEVADRILNLIPDTSNSAGADHYRQSAKYALGIIIGALKLAKRRYHFSDIVILLQSPAALTELARALPEGTAERRNYLLFIDQYQKRQNNGAINIDMDKLRNLLGGLAGRMGALGQGKVGQVLNSYTPEMDLSDLVKNNKCAYIMLPSMAKPDTAMNIGKMALADLRSAVYNIQALKQELRPDPPFLVFADEMGSYVMQGIARLFEQARSANMCLVPAFQSFANLASVNREFADMIIGNTWNKFFFKFGGGDSPETAAEIMGMTKKFALSMSKSDSEGASASNIRVTPQSNESKSGGLAESYRESEEYRVTPDQLKALGIGESIAISGSRVFHIAVPRIEWPKPMPEYQVLRRRIAMPRDERPLDYEARYREFLSSAPDAGGP